MNCTMLFLNLSRTIPVSYTHLDVYKRQDLLLAHGRSLDIVSQAELIAAPLGSQPTYELLATASAVAEVAERCTYCLLYTSRCV